MSLAADDEELITRFEPFSLLNVPLEELLEVKSMRLRFGKVDAELWDELRHVAESEFGAFIFRSGFSGDKVCCILLTLTGGVLREEERLVEYGFESEDRPNAAGLTGIPAERMAQLRGGRRCQKTGRGARRRAGKARGKGKGRSALKVLLAQIHERGFLPSAARGSRQR